MAPTQRVVLAIVGFLGGVLTASVLASLVVSATGWELSVSASIGSELGRTVRQVGQAAPLDDHRVPAAWLAVVNAPLWLGLAGAPLLARRAGLSWRRDLGWGMSAIDIPAGLALGIATQFALIPLYEVIFLLFGEQDVSGPARSLVASVDSPLDLLGLLLITVVMAPLTEEIAYRGLLFGASVTWSAAMSVGRGRCSGGVLGDFRASHFQLIQFPGLFVFGLVALRPSIARGDSTAIWATSASISRRSCCCSGRERARSSTGLVAHPGGAVLIAVSSVGIGPSGAEKRQLGGTMVGAMTDQPPLEPDIAVPIHDEPAAIDLEPSCGGGGVGSSIARSSRHLRARRRVDRLRRLERPARLWFDNTTPTGGDMGAHVWSPAYLRDVLLPAFRLTGGRPTGTPDSRPSPSTW